MSLLPRHSGQRTFQRGFPKSRRGNPLGDISLQRIRRRNVEEKDPWRGSRYDNRPSSPSMASRNEVWKTEGVSTFFRGVLVRGHGIHITPGFGGVRARTPPKLGSNGIRDKCTNTSSSHTNLRWRFAQRLSVCTLLLTRYDSMTDGQTAEVP